MLFFSGKLAFRGNRNQYKSSSYLRCFHRSVQYCILRRSHRSVHCCIRIMPWSASQQTRLGYEKQLLEQYFRGNRATWIDPTGNARVEIRVTCSSNRDYTLRIYIPVDFPNACPQMVVCNPSHCLVKRNGTVMSSADSDDHTWGSKDGCTQICHYKPAEWTDDNTLYQVTMKGLIWLEAYEAHLRTGNSLSNYLQHY